MVQPVLSRLSRLLHTICTFCTNEAEKKAERKTFPWLFQLCSGIWSPGRSLFKQAETLNIISCYLCFQLCFPFFSHAAVGRFSVPEDLFVQPFLKSFKPFKVFFLFVCFNSNDFFFQKSCFCFTGEPRANWCGGGCIHALQQHISEVCDQILLNFLLFKA